jgi:hypothetical protein
MKQRQKQLHLLPASRLTLPALRFTTSGQYTRVSGYKQRPLTSRHQNGPNVCSYKRIANSGQRVAA